MNLKAKFLSKKKLIITSILLVLVIVSLVLFFVLKKDNEEDPLDKYIVMAQNAIDNTENIDECYTSFNTSSLIELKESYQNLNTSGNIIRIKNDEANDIETLVSINSSSSTYPDSKGDYEITANLFSDGEKVYDNTSGTNIEVDMTADEFKEITDKFELYHFDVNDVKSTSYEPFSEMVNEGGQVVVNLKNPNDNVLEAYAAAIGDLLEENVKKDDLITKSALVIYSISQNRIVSQTCSFVVEYEHEGGENIRYSGSTQIAFDYNISDKINEIEEGSK